MTGAAARVVQEGMLDNQTLLLGDGSEFDLGTPGTRHHARRLRKYIRTRMRREPEFRAAFTDTYGWTGRLR